MKILALIAGGSIGTLLRFWLASGTNRLSAVGFPTGTLLVNLIGCMVIGILAGLNHENSWSETTRLFLFTGLLGGFTTFSSFGLETIQFLNSGQTIQAISYILISNFGGIGLAYAAYAFFSHQRI